MTTPRPQGRPPKIHTIVATIEKPDGTTIEITAAERIIQAIRMGNYIETAAATAGVAKVTVYDWLKTGARANDRHHRQGIPLSKLTAAERRCMDFANAVAEAEALSEADDVATAAELAAGGRQHTTTTTKRDHDGNVIEHVTKVETMAPNPAVLTWRLERRFPDRWGRRKLEVSGPDGEAIPVEVRAQSIAKAARAWAGDTEDARADDDGVLDTDQADDQTT